MSGPDRTERWLRRVYRVFLRTLPSGFRLDFGRDMEETFADRLRHARQEGRSALGVAATAAVDVIRTGIRERVAPRVAEPGMMHWQDVRYAGRLLARSPVFTALTVVVLAGGLALSIFTFSFLHTAIVRPLPLGDGDRIVRVSEERGGSTGGIDAAELEHIRPSITTLTDIGAFTSRQLVVGEHDRRHVLDATAIEWSVFQVTRTPPAMGRGFLPDDAAAGAEPVIVLGHRTWEVDFGADSTVVDRVVTLNGTSTRVIGVMPSGYGFPVAAEAWVPLTALDLERRTPDAESFDLFARIVEGSSSGAASAELETLIERVRRDRVPSDAERSAMAPWRINVRSFPRAQIGNEAPLVLGILNLLAALILLLSCINVINLLLARANDRARETAVRLALGASRSRLIMQNLWESVLLAAAGGTLATLIAAWGLSAINRWTHAHLEGNLAFWWVWGMDRAGLIAACGFVAATMAVIGAAVSARVTSTRFNEVLQDSGARGRGRRAGRITRLLVATQVSTVSVLMFFGVMSAIVAWRVVHLDLGYDTRNLLGSSIATAADRHTTRSERGTFWESVVNGLAQRSEVDGVVLRANLAEMGSDRGTMEIDGRVTPQASRPRAYVVSALGALETLGIAVREGRLLEGVDRADGVPVAVVSESFARRHWPRRSPIGQRIRLSGAEGESAAPWRTVVGVASDVLFGNPLSRNRSADAVWVPLGQTDASSGLLLFRHRGDEAAAQFALQQVLAGIDPMLGPPDVSPFEEMLAKSTLIATSVAKLFAMCFGFALVLAVSGTYGLMARSIGQRTREIGVRRALGATDARIVRLLLGQGGRQLGVGAIVALPAMLAVGAGFAHFFPIALASAMTIGVLVAATIVGVVLAATYLPTRQALAVAPREALWKD